MFANQKNGQKSKLVKIAFQLFCVCLLSGVMQAGDMANPFDVCPHGVKTVVAAPANPAPKVSLSLIPDARVLWIGALLCLAMLVWRVHRKTARRETRLACSVKSAIQRAIVELQPYDARLSNQSVPAVAGTGTAI
jgi:hypothetical protein